MHLLLVLNAYFYEWHGFLHKQGTIHFSLHVPKCWSANIFRVSADKQIMEQCAGHSRYDIGGKDEVSRRSAVKRNNIKMLQRVA